MKTSTSKSAQDLLRDAVEIGYREGVAGIGGRALSRHAGVSASAVNYHFGGREPLLAAVADAAAAAERAEMEARLAAAADLPAHLRSMSDFVAALAIELACHNPGRTLLLREFAAAGHRPPPAGSFWTRAAQTLGASGQAELWSVLFDGALGLAVLDSDRVVAATLLGRVAQRFDARLQGRQDPSVSDEAPEQTLLAEADAAQRQRSARAEQIVAAAVDLLLNGEPLSHRSVAAKAGVSLAATTSHFTSKAEIVLEAYRVLYRRMFEAAGGDTGFGEPFTADGSLRPSYAATERLILAAARDPALRPFALKMRNVRGRTSADHLRESGTPDADRLDGLLWSLCHAGAQRLAMARAPHERVGAFVQLMQAARRALFAPAFPMASAAT